jgi:hypothetical protein
MHFLYSVSHEIQSINLLILALNALLHLLFAGAVAKDAGLLAKNGQKTILVSPLTWGFAALVGGVLVAVVYWLMHHVNFKRH